MVRLSKLQVRTLLNWWNINQPRNNAEARLRTREFLKLALRYGVKKKTFKSGKFKGMHIYKLDRYEYLVSANKRNWVLN